MRPKSGSRTGRVWDVADEITRETGRRAKRMDVMRSIEAEGGNPNTASTQYSLWKSQYENGHREPGRGSLRSDVLAIQVKEAGRLVVPLELRNALNIQEGDTLTARLVDGEIRLMPLATAIQRAQALVREFVPHGVKLVDELIEDRRSEERR